MPAHTGLPDLIVGIGIWYADGLDPEQQALLEKFVRSLID
ncbi:hypothetical protein ALO37_200001 [Pseudomonas savastanoi pv. glycinea]|uniref:Uncharacterized protein n=1 Tax=Pseudomonas savastanoi pv. glycinea str. race 4 TaxID=875330 RepID=F3C9Z3_PSESG|nr:hypothetical protein Pgy4_23628 [Pseudomonas savastanoi pv. glycinea str. race 4]KPX44692.1 hypothetical protein ALO37_200001 [Pseudomonas savastanoi pv. glycinea]